MRFQVLFSLALAAIVVAKSGDVASASQNQVQELSKEVSGLDIQALIQHEIKPTVRARKFGNHSVRSAPNGLLQKVGELIAALEKALGVTALEDALDKVLPLKPVEDALGLSKLEQSLNLIGGCNPDGVLQYVGKLVKYLEDKLGVTALEDTLNKTLGGTLYDLLDSIGLTKVEKEGLDL